VGRKKEERDPSMITTESANSKGFPVVKYTPDQTANKKMTTSIETQAFLFSGWDDHRRDGSLFIDSLISITSWSFG
jgi:hypothetical protein